jgi:hypothetical protein
MGRLRQAAQFDRGELAAMLSARGTALAALNPLIAPLGAIPIEDYRVGYGRLLERPIVRSGERLIVAVPGMLMPAAWNAIILLASESGLLRDFALQYRRSVWIGVDQSVRRLGGQVLPAPFIAPIDDAPVEQRLYRIDADKAMYVILISDPLDNYGPGSLTADWQPDSLADRIEHHIAGVEASIASEMAGIDDVLFLVLMQGTGRAAHIRLPSVTAGASFPIVGMTAENLEVLSLLESDDALALWKFAKAHDVARESAGIVAFSTLDEFHFYRQNDYSYYASDSVRPNVIAIPPGGAGVLRREALHKRDWHGVSSHEAGYVVEVTSLHDTAAIPIYVPSTVLDVGRRHHPAAVVEGLSVPIWIVGRSSDSSDDPILTYQWEFSELIAYWLWQVSPSLLVAMASLSRALDRIVITNELASPELWTSEQPAETGRATGALHIRVDAEHGHLDITIEPAVVTLLDTADNAGERRILLELLVGLRQLLPPAERRHLSDEALPSIVDRHAPLGPKKKALLIREGRSPDLNPAGLPRYRRVKAHDESELLDELGAHLKEAGIAEGAIAAGQHITVLNRAVAYFYRALADLVATLRRDGLVEWLLSFHEAAVFHSSMHRLTVPTRLACFSSEQEMVEKLREELPEDSKTAMASRFVIEYVAARPPSGLRPMSLSVYDRLQALASQIIDFGFESDLEHFSLADFRLALLPSGRLGADRERFTRARSSFLSVLAGDEIVRAAAALERHYASPDHGADKPDAARRIDEAAVAEFGFSITELVALMGEAVNVGTDAGHAAVALPVAAVIEQLKERLGWPAERITGALDLLSLRPRADFLRPPAPHEPVDVYPWRFNRDLSLLRRPFIVDVRGDEPRLLWGNRHVFVAWQYLVNLCMTGRLRARSAQMKSLMGQFHHVQGEQFNDRVADLCERRDGLIVRRRVKKLPGVFNIPPPPGDIDVLVADLRAKRVVLIECKDFAAARTPAEMANELKSLIGDEEGDKSAEVQHRKRLDWARTHLRAILAWLGIANTAGWRVEPLFVVDEELMSPHLVRMPMPVRSISRLDGFWVEGRASR